MKSKKNILICFDQDGTLIHDERFHLGSQRNWKKMVKILPDVVTGIKLLKKKIPKAKLYIITNQKGIAIKNFALLTPDKSAEVSEYIINQLKKKGAVVDGFELCGHVSKDYVKKRPQYKFDNKVVCEYSCIKPQIGMIRKILGREEWKLEETEVYVIGDRYSDVKTGLNAEGYGILVPRFEGKENIEKLARYGKKEDKKKTFIAKDFLDASKFIVKKVK